MNAQDERNRTLRERAEDWREEGLIEAESQRAVHAALPVPWRTYGVIAQCVFFLLTAIGMGATYVLLAALPRRGLVVGLLFIGIAELLIRRRWFRTGVESALWLGGLLAMTTELPHSRALEALLVIAAACAIAGLRVRNPLFGAAAAILVMVYAETKFDRGVIVALAIALVAVLALLRTWRRPSTEWLWIVLAIVMPVAGWFTADAKWRTMTIALYATFGFVALVLGIAKRHHALILAGAIGLVAAEVELSKMIDTPLEAKLAAGGAFLLALAFLLSRALRSRTSGLVVTPARLTRIDDALTIAGALAASQASRSEAPAQPEPGRAQGEGGFGGAGATGDY
jgi:hypothetical protein